MFGRKHELLIIASCPGDFHPGELHKRFSKYNGVWVRFIPVQYSRASFANNCEWTAHTCMHKLEVLLQGTDTSHVHARIAGKHWWDTYFQRALQEAQDNGGVSIIKILAITGGGAGCAEERSELSLKFRTLPNLSAMTAIFGMPSFMVDFFINKGSTPVEYYEADPDTAEAYITRRSDRL